MAPQFRKIPGDLPALPPRGSEFSPRFIQELGRYVEPDQGTKIYSKALDLIEQNIRKKILPEDKEAIDIVYDVLAKVAGQRDEWGRLQTDYEVGVRKLVAGAADRAGSNWPKKLADEIVAIYLGEGPDGTTIGAMKLSKRAASGGRA